jgi:hypothetical protein
MARTLVPSKKKHDNILYITVITESKDRTDIFLASQVSDMKKRISVNYIDFLISVYLN